jgi:hypothetical protein
MSVAGADAWVRPSHGLFHRCVGGDDMAPRRFGRGAIASEPSSTSSPNWFWIVSLAANPKNRKGGRVVSTRPHGGTDGVARF